LKIDYSVTTTKTAVNLTNHTYFNWRGGSGDVMKTVLRIEVRTNLSPVDSGLIRRER